MKRTHIQHLYRRIGFGILPKPLELQIKKNTEQVVDDLFLASNKITPLKVDTSLLSQMINTNNYRDKSVQKKFIKGSIKKIKELNLAWIDRLISPKELLREKMTLFWANHFVCEDKNIIHVQQFNNTLRQFALGNFKDFVKAVSKEPTMIKYLNTKQNKKQTPNENFARELMELFTLGIGNYTETDIKECARAFTGYNHSFKGDFVLRRFQHDEGEKTFFGKTGNFNGDDIIDIILEQEQCARFICRKIYRYFVNDEIDSSHIDDMVTIFNSSYNIEELLRYVLNSNWFYDEQNIGSKIKSPIEFLVGIHALVPMKFTNSKDVFIMEKLLGQILFNPPNVAGWKGGKSWIDSNTIMLRLKLPSILLNGAYISKEENDDLVAMNTLRDMQKRKSFQRFKVESNWGIFQRNFKNVSLEDLKEHILCEIINPDTEHYLSSLIKSSKREYCVQLMSLPEYQMC